MDLKEGQTKLKQQKTHPGSHVPPAAGEAVFCIAKSLKENTLASWLNQYCRGGINKWIRHISGLKCSYCSRVSMYALWPSSRGTCVPLQSRDAHETQTHHSARPKRMKCRPVDNKLQKQPFFWLFASFIWLHGTFASSRLLGYSLARRDLCVLSVWNQSLGFIETIS